MHPKKLPRYALLPILALLSPLFANAATIYLTQPTDTLDTFRTNANTSLTNLNTAISGSAFGTTSISAATPLGRNTSTAQLSIQAASASQSGYLSATDWSLLHTATTTFSAPISYSLSTNAVTCPTCLTSNQTITLSGAVSGSGSTAITTSYAGTLGNTLGGTGQNSSAWTGLVGTNSGGWYSISTSTALNTSISGNAGTATALQNARTINGVSFNGTANIVVASTTLLGDTNSFTGILDTFSHSTSTLGTITTGWATNWYDLYASSTELTLSGNLYEAASSTFAAQINAQGASTTLLTNSGATYLTGLTTGTGNGALCLTSAGIVEYSSGANCITGSSASSTILGDNNTFSGNDTFSKLLTLTTGASTSVLTTSSAFWDTGQTASTLAGFDNNHQLVSTTSIYFPSFFTGVLPIANGGTAASSQTTGYPLYYNGTSITASSTLYVGWFNATTTAATSTFAGQLSIATTTSALTNYGIQGTLIGTTTISGNGQNVNIAASSTSGSGQITPNWNTGNQQIFLLTGTCQFNLNSTSSNPVNGGYYSMYIQQDGTGSRQCTWDAQNVRWANGTTTISSAANSCTLIGFHYLSSVPNGTVPIYLAIASSTASVCY